MATRSVRQRTAKTHAPKKTKSRYWSGEVTRDSNAVDHEPAVFMRKTIAQIAEALR